MRLAVPDSGAGEKELLLNSTMRSVLFTVWLSHLTIVAIAQTDGWALIAKTKFDAKYNEKAGGYFLYPTFSDELLAKSGKDLELEGYYLPIEVEGNAYVILSKFPYSQCFFCGGAGPESIVEIYFKGSPPRFDADQFIRVRGKLRLNEKDIEHGNFMLEQAVLVEK